MYRSAMLAGLQGDAQQVAQKTGTQGNSFKALQKGMGEVVLIHASGEAPRKRQYSFKARMPDGYLMRIALPELTGRKHRIAYVQVEAQNISGRSEPAEPIARIAMQNFKHRLPGLKARAIARAATKYTATKVGSKVAEKAGGKDNGKLLGALVGLAGNVASAVSEAADLRSWTLLPAEISVARLWLPEGTHQVTVRYFNRGGAEIRQNTPFTVQVKAGQRQLLSVRSFK